MDPVEVATEIIENQSAAESAAQSAAVAEQAAESAIALAHAAAATAELQAAQEVREVAETIENLEQSESWQNQKITELERNLLEVKEVALNLKTTMAEMMALLAASQSSAQQKPAEVLSEAEIVEIPQASTVVVQNEGGEGLPAAEVKTKQPRLRRL